jgi:hypothetical protein
VATARVAEVEPDGSVIRIERQIKGVQPGDRVRVVFATPDISPEFNKAGGATVRRKASSSNGSQIITILLVLGLVAVLLGNGGSSGSSSTSGGLTAEPLLFPNESGDPAVKLSWNSGLFNKGNDQQYAWQIWRNDLTTSPALVVPGNQRSAIDTSQPRTFQWSDFQGFIGGSTCRFSDPPLDDATVAGVVPGRPLSYQIELVYRLNSIDLPGTTGTGGGTGTTTTGTTTTGTTTTGTTTTGTTTGGTGTTTTGTTTTGTTTGGGTGGDADFCYFLSGRTNARGLATPLDGTTLQAPADNATIPPANGSSTDPNRLITFQFNSVATIRPLTAEYIVQVSTSPVFARNVTRQVGTRVSNATGIVSIAVPNNFFTDAETVIYWRVGARNTADKPGPIADKATKQRFIFSQPRSFQRPQTIPPPPRRGRG